VGKEENTLGKYVGEKHVKARKCANNIKNSICQENLTCREEKKDES